MKKYLSKSLLFKSSLSLGLCVLIAFDAIPTYAQNLPARIDIVVVEGEGVSTTAGHRVTRDPAVRVEDDDHRPVTGVAVVFSLPVSGTTGEFSGGSKTSTVVTDKNGLAVVHGLKTNDLPGKLQIYVTASYHGLHARTLINQVVEPAPGYVPRLSSPPSASHGNKWKWIVLGVAAAGGAGAGFYFASHGSSSPISISAGAVSFGSPR